MKVNSTITMKVKFAMKARRPGFSGGPFLRHIEGDDFHRDTGLWNKLVRRIDRMTNRYYERLEDGRTGTVIREVDEPLTDHTGHGSAKPKSE